MKRLGIAAALFLSAGTVGATINTYLYETKEVSNSAEFIQALQDAAATNALYTYGRYFCTFKLHPGVYDVSTLAMNANYHIYLPTFYCGQMLGLGEKPGDVVITGGGAAAADPKSVMWVSSGSYQSFVVSNLTVTGGYGGGIGGGIAGGYTTLTKITDCIITNNYSPSQGGGVWQATLERCVIRDNSAATRGGGVAAAYCTDCEIVSNRVTVSTMSTTGGGGATGGSFTRCVFKGNSSTADGGGALHAAAVDCVFDGNDCSASGYGGHVFKGAYTNCVFRNGDSRKGMTSVHASVGYLADLVDCVISNTYCTLTLIEDCNLTRCRYTDNESTYNHGQISCDASKYSVVNCVFDHNRALGGTAASLFSKCNVVNCTIADNSFYASNTRFGALGIQGRRVNCVCTGNSPADYSYEAGTAPTMTNTYWVTQRVAPPAGFCSGGGQVANLCLKRDGVCPYLPRTSSPAYNGGYSDEAILQLVGLTDYYGRTRVALGRLDAGAVEHQQEDDVGFVVQCR